MNEYSTSTSSSSSAGSISSASSNINISISQVSNNNPKNKKLFPKKLWDLINNEKYYFCLRWSDDGQLVYLNRDEFEDSYLKTAENQFHTQKAISFVRQMNMYGFRKVDDCYYENDNFKRDCEHLLKNMIRKHPNKNQPRQQNGAAAHHHQSQQEQLSDDLIVPKIPNVSSMAQQTPTNLPDLSGAASFGTDQLVPELGGPDLRAFYALLSSLSGNLYTGGQPDYQGPLFEPGGKFPSASILSHQIIYQSLLAQQEAAAAAAAGSLQLGTTPATTTTMTKDLFAHSSAASPIQMAPKWTPIASSQPSMLLDRVTSATSLLAPSNNSAANDLSLKGLKSRHPEAASSNISATGGLRCDSPAGDSLLRRSSATGETPLPMSLAKRQQSEQRLHRSFKRSVDSILDSNDNPESGSIARTTAARNTLAAAATAATNKRMKQEFHPNHSHHSNHHQQHRHHHNQQENSNNKKRPVNLVSGVNELAKNLVSEIALARDAHLDSNVLLEASKYTESFVQTLFDTALVISRHSNGLNLSDYMLAADANGCQRPAMEENVNEHDVDDDGDEDEEDEEADASSVGHQEIEYERSNISVSDLTSALKLLPSKLLKILQ